MIRILYLFTCLGMTACLEPALSGNTFSPDASTDDASTTDASTTDAQDNDTGKLGCGVGELLMEGQCVCDVANGFSQCESADGCTATSDCPDALGDGIDSNHDGADGHTALTVFVSAARGQDTNDGLVPSAPVRSLSRAAEQLENTGRTTILLEEGNYEAPGTWTVARPEFNLWGGYAEGFVAAPNANKTKITNAAGTPTLTLNGGNLVRLGMITLQPPANPIKHAITLRIENSNVVFSNVEIMRGFGVAGGPGNAGSNGAAGGDATLDQGGSVTCQGVQVEGGNGGTGGSCADSLDTAPTPSGHGTDGFGNRFNNGGGGAGTNHCASINVSHGGKGADRLATGAHGSSGQDSPITGLVINGAWTNGDRAASGMAGQNGDSGAGGGGGGGVRGVNPPINGGNGGGGGSGGCGGMPGTGGEHGGDSIGILALGASTLSNAVFISDGVGGKGGDGKGGGSGAPGGEPALGQTHGASMGGAGGKGGPGGKGGSGAGGNGGSIYGVAYGAQTQLDDLTVNTQGATPGQPGAGPTSAGNSGKVFEKKMFTAQ